MKPSRGVKIESPDGVNVVRPMTLSGIVRTTRGFAVATVELAADGSVLSVKLGNSQSEKQFVAGEHVKMLPLLAGRA